jgi:hypothetical protein
MKKEQKTAPVFSARPGESETVEVKWYDQEPPTKDFFVVDRTFTGNLTVFRNGHEIQKNGTND